MSEAPYNWPRSPAEAVALLQAALPELAVGSCRYLAQGWDSVAYELDDALIFRFPKRAAVAARQAFEVCVVRALGPALPVPVPDFAYVVPGAPAGTIAFAGYHKLSGVPLDAAPNLLTTAAPLLPSLAGFLTALHRWPLADCPCELPAADWGAWVGGWQAFARDLGTDAATLLDASERAALGRLWNALLAELARPRATSLVHRDLALEHILVTPDGQQVTSVIDWGDVTVGDPAIDFAAFARPELRGILPFLLASYRGPRDDGFARRAAWYGRLAPLHELRFGLEVDAADHVEAGLRDLRRLLAGWME